MKFIYPAVFRKTENGTYHGFFPDLECCYADGDTLDDAIDNANEAAYNWISLELSEDDCNLPSVSDKEDMELQEGDIVRNISVNIRFYEGWGDYSSQPFCLHPTYIIIKSQNLIITCNCTLISNASALRCMNCCLSKYRNHTLG